MIVDSDLTEKLNIVAQTGFSIYILDGPELSILPRKGTVTNKAAIHSVPKAGTYLLASLLEASGYLDTETHLGVDGFSDYRCKTLKQKRENYLDFTVGIHACDVAKLVLDGQFVVGHLPCNEAIRYAFASFKQLFIIRELRDSLISHMRFLATRNNPSHEVWKRIPDDRQKLVKYIEFSAHEFMNLAEPMLGWLCEPDVLTVRFETLLGDDGENARYREIKKILDYLEVSDQVVIDDQFLRNVFGVETLTWSGKRTTRSDYWSDEAESLFKEIGGDKLNRWLGYTESADHLVPLFSDQAVTQRPC